MDHAKRARQIDPELPDSADRNGSLGIHALRSSRLCCSNFGSPVLRLFCPPRRRAKQKEEIVIYVRYPGRRSFLACPGLLSCRPSGTSDRLYGQTGARVPASGVCRPSPAVQKRKSLFFSLAKHPLKPPKLPDLAPESRTSRKNLIQKQAKKTE